MLLASDFRGGRKTNSVSAQIKTHLCRGKKINEFILRPNRKRAPQECDIAVEMSFGEREKDHRGLAPWKSDKGARRCVGTGIS